MTLAKRSRKGTGSIYFDQAKGKWIGEARQTVNGKRKARRCEADSKTDASARLRHLLIELSEQRMSYDSSTETVGEYLRSWRASLTSGPSTLLRHDSLLRKHIFPDDISNKRLCQITTKNIKHFYAALKTSVSSSTARKTHAVLHAAFEAALHSRSGFNRNPSALPKNQIPKYKPSEASPLSTEKELALLRALAGDSYEALYIMALDSGMRQAELFALEWRCVD